LLPLEFSPCCIRLHSDNIQGMSDTEILTLRLDSKTKKKLDKLAKATERSRSFLAAQAIREFLELNEWQIEEIKKGLREADAGDFASDAEVERVMRKWTRRAG
jgi:RHH-type rel operon transcriptional repressor/antitoxin RelB